MPTARCAKPEELEALIALSDRTFRKPGQTSMGTAYAMLFSENNAENLLVMEEDGIPATLVGLLPMQLSVAGCAISAVGMGSVCTETAYRGRNFADTLVKMAIDQCRENDVHVLLISGNRSLYLRNDCMEVGSVRHFTLMPGEDWQGLAEQAGTVRPYDEERDVRAMLRLMEADQAYYRRSPEEMSLLIRSAAVMSNYSAEQHVLVHTADNGEMLGYIVVGLPAKGDSLTAEVVEYAGGDETVVRLLSEVAGHFKPERTNVPVMPHRHALAEKLASTGCAVKETTIPGTIRMIDFTGMWHALRPYMAGRIGEEAASRLECVDYANGNYRIRLGNETLTVDLRGATTLVFNGPQLTGQGELKRVLGELFPLPFVYTSNLNFV
ncbi:GNAT family N-acetyltransferase [Paenibacillus hamazuiensis]|uniref:GNAT family N-acetyltransferase n=1 Tax=Paenibacillus hamazuiensis TaxID=2936508 RepID=UPI00200E4BF2|nr:GNAT family N-acetyltransferase [Paenibacillus hamazuiensis]